MAAPIISHTRVAGVASAVPSSIETLDVPSAIFGEAEAQKISASIGVRRRHVAQPGMCTSDLCAAAAEQLLKDLNWPRESIDGLIFVSQTPDYLLPSTSCSLHARLGLAKHCASLDINLGCSGYIYGLWIASQMVQSGSLKRALLLVGDTITQIVSPQDRSAALLFGDAGTATALEHDDTAQPMAFSLGTDGTGQLNLIVPTGGFRHSRSPASRERMLRDDGCVRSDEDLYMNGAEIFTFSLREVPPLIHSVLNTAGWSIGDVDAVVMHQANRFMLEVVAKRLKLPAEKLILAMEDRGNTSSASIPLALTDGLAHRLKAGPLRLVLAGFGVGYSWGAVALRCGPLVMPELVLLEAPSPTLVGRETR